MKTNRTEFRYFPITEWEREQEYLRRRHNQGWKLTKVNLLGIYHFEKCQPEDVIYQLDYNPEGLENKEEYLQMFADCDWEYIQDYVQYSYFRKPARQATENEEEAIFSDDVTRLDMLKRVFKGRVVPLIVIFFALIFPQIFLKMWSPIVLYTMIFLYLAIFLAFGYRYWELLKRFDR